MFGSLLWGYGLSGIRPAIESAANRGKAATGSSKRFEVKSLQSAEAERCVSVGRNGRATVQATSAARKVCSEIEQLVVLGNLRFSLEILLCLKSMTSARQQSPKSDNPSHRSACARNDSIAAQNVATVCYDECSGALACQGVEMRAAKQMPYEGTLGSGQAGAPRLRAGYLCTLL